jgi:hypothetical protein
MRRRLTSRSGWLEFIACFQTQSRWRDSKPRPRRRGPLLRATPGLDRARCDNTLTPCRQLDAREIAPALEHVQAFARRHDLTPGSR